MLIYNGTGYDTYYYQTSVHGGSGWRLSTDVHANAGGVSIPVGSALIIRRRGLAGFNWFPPVPVANN